MATAVLGPPCDVVLVAIGAVAACLYHPDKTRARPPLERKGRAEVSTREPDPYNTVYMVVGACRVRNAELRITVSTTEVRLPFATCA